MKNMKIGIKLLLGFFAVIVLTVVVGLAGWIGLSGVSKRANNTENMGSIVQYILEARREEKNFIIRKDEASIKKQADAYEKTIALAKQAKDLFKLKKQQDQMDQIIEQVNNYQKTFLSYIEAENAKNQAMEKMRQDARQVLANAENQKNLRQTNNDLVNELMINLLMARKAEKEYIISNDEKYKTEQKQYWGAAKNYAERINNQQSTENSRELLSNVESYKSAFDQFVSLLDNQTDMDKTMVETARQAIATCKETQQEQVMLMKAETARSFSIISIFTLLAIALSIIITYAITSAIVNPVKKGVEFAQNIAGGDLTVTINVDRKDEIGQLVNALRQMAEKIKEIVLEVQEGANQITAASQEISSASQNMSQGATEQAASLEEISSSMEQMVANIKQNADNAQETQKIASQSVGAITTGSTSTMQSLDAMQNIANKILIINDIASQTNILALNAAVEAARAGDVGKGFAVVATEVRKLAERSRIAADEISILSKNGVAISQMSGQQLLDIVPQIEKTANLVQEITAASLEQDTGADQINSAIQQLNMVSQQNASASEEMAANSEELASQALSLQQIISYFKTNERISANTSHKHQTKSVPQQHAKIQKSTGKVKGAVEKINTNKILSKIVDERTPLKQNEPQGYKIEFEGDESADRQFQSF
jgi:methyl-accepting chemotaxis protein